MSHDDGEPTADELRDNVIDVRSRIERAQQVPSRNPPSVVGAAASPPAASVRLVAVSKTKSARCMTDAYHAAGVRVFGENYVQEAVAKSPHLPPDVDIHFIGHLQSNKVRELVRGCRQLTTVETVDSVKLADVLEKEWQQRPNFSATGDGAESKPQRDDDVRVADGHSEEEDTAASGAGRPQRLTVYVQINTSAEESKSGLASSDTDGVVALCRHIVTGCPHLHLGGFMTIGRPSDYSSTPEDFATLARVRRDVALAVGGLNESELELSMGMSGDFEAAVAMGATNVRVGSRIFGARAPKERPAVPPPPS